MLDFLLIYELPQRELENMILIETQLKKMGYRVATEKFPYQNEKRLREKYFNNVNTILVHSLYDEKVIFNLVYKIAGKAIRIVNMQWEQVGTFESEKNYLGYRYPKGDAKNALHICWGEVPQMNLINANVNKKQTLVTGPIQMDFTRKQFSNYYLTRKQMLVENGFSDNKETVLFISSFSYASLNNRRLKELKNKIGRNDVESFRNLSIESQKIIIDWIRNVLKENPSLNFIYRPHPAEYSNESLKALELEYENFKVIGNSSVKQWVRVADKIYTWYSTSVAEIYFSGKNCEILRPLPIEKEKEVTILDNSKKITTFIEFQRSLKLGQSSSLDDKAILNYYNHQDQEAYKRLTNELNNIYQNNLNTFKWDNYLLLKFKFKLIYTIFKSLVRESYYWVLKKLINNKKLKYPTFINDKIEGYKKRLDKMAKTNIEIERILKRRKMIENLIDG